MSGGEGTCFNKCAKGIDYAGPGARGTILTTRTIGIGPILSRARENGRDRAYSENEQERYGLLPTPVSDKVNPGEPEDCSMTTTTGRITKSPDICGGDACVRGHRIPVWCLVGLRQLGADDDRILEAYPGITLEDLEAAWDYYAANRDEIDRAIIENEDTSPLQ
jgi:uncharacterized protein (DUF433 family)